MAVDGFYIQLGRCQSYETISTKNGRSDAKQYVPHRKVGEKLQVIAVVNFFKGKKGLGKPLRPHT